MTSLAEERLESKREEPSVNPAASEKRRRTVSAAGVPEKASVRAARWARNVRTSSAVSVRPDPEMRCKSVKNVRRSLPAKNRADTLRGVMPASVRRRTAVISAASPCRAKSVMIFKSVLREGCAATVRVPSLSRTASEIVAASARRRPTVRPSIVSEVSQRPCGMDREKRKEKGKKREGKRLRVSEGKPQTP